VLKVTDEVRAAATNQRQAVARAAEAALAAALAAVILALMLAAVAAGTMAAAWDRVTAAVGRFGDQTTTQVTPGLRQRGW
jgi:hypothetical protein